MCCKGLVERNDDVGVDAELDVLHAGIIMGTCAETDAPTDGQLAGERQSGAATCLVAHDGDERHLLHAAGKGVGCAIARAVDEQHDWLLPANAVKGFDVFRPRF